MIEEAERTYLRKVGGFKGIAHLIRWIHRTGGHDAVGDRHER